MEPVSGWWHRLRARRATARLGRLLDPATDLGAGPVALLGPGAGTQASALRARLPGVRVVAVSREELRGNLLMTGLGPFARIVDLGDRDGRRWRFERAFFQLRAGGAYLVPAGADELGNTPGRLGRLLATRPAPGAGSLRAERRRQHLPATRAVAMRDHVTARARAGDLVVTHDLPDVLVKIPEQRFNAYLARFRTPHQVLDVVAAVPPPAAPAFREGPQPKHPRTDRPIRQAERSLRYYRDVTVAPQQVVLAGRLILPDTYRHHAARHLLNKRLADVAPMFAVPKDPITEERPRLPGIFVHLDNEARGHFGHLITESLSRAWSWQAAREWAPDVRALVGVTPQRPRLLDYELEIYAAMGLPRERIVLIDGPVRVEHLISGTPMFSQPDFVDPRIAGIWREVGDRLAEQAVVRQWPRRFFVARRTPKRACVNAQEVEAVFVEHGFTVLHPEDYPLGDQIALFRQAEVVAGYAGSGLFHLALAPRPTRLIMIGSEAYAARNEYLIAAVHGHRVDSTVCRVFDPHAHSKSMQASFRFDAEREGPFLRALLREL